MELWDGMWQPPSKRTPVKGEELLLMVLAIGARVSSFEGKQDVNVSEGWAAYFSKRADDATNLFENPSLRSTHFLLLKVSSLEPHMLVQKHRTHNIANKGVYRINQC